MKLRQKTIFDITAGDVVKIIVLYKISRVAYRVVDGVAQKLYDRNKEDINAWVDKEVKKVSDKTVDKVVDTVYPPKDDESPQE